MSAYKIEVIIRNKRVARDPEGETIQKELIGKSSYAAEVKSVRSGKWLLFEVEAESLEKALEEISRMCKELRIFNPVVHEMEVRPYQSGSA